MDAEIKSGVVSQIMSGSQKTLEALFSYECKIYLVCIERKVEIKFTRMNKNENSKEDRNNIIL